MKQIFVKCACCDGFGTAPLSKPLQATLSAILQSFPCTASEVYERFKNPKLDRSAANQRLKKLERIGFIKSKKVKRSLRVYWPV
jgi:predicted transcriptional regulator